MSSTDGPFIPMVSSSPPPMDDGFDEDEDDFGSFSHYGSDLVGSSPALKSCKATTKPDINFKPVKEEFASNVHNGNGDEFGSFTRGITDSEIDDDFGDFADASNGNSFPSSYTEGSQNTLKPLTNGNSAHSDDWQSNGNQGQSIASLTDVKKQTLDLFSEFHSSNANDSKDAVSKDSTSVSSMDDDFSDFSAFTSGATPGHIPNDEKDTSSRNDKQSSTPECPNLNQIESINSTNIFDGDKNLKDSSCMNESLDIIGNSDTESAMTVGGDKTHPNCNAFQKQYTLSEHPEMTNDDGFAEFDSEKNEKLKSSNPDEFGGFGSFHKKPVDVRNLKTTEASGEVSEKKCELLNADSVTKVGTSKPEVQDDDFASFSSFSKPSKKGFSENSLAENQMISENVFTAKEDEDFGAFESKPATESDDFGNFDSKPVTTSKDFGNFESKTTTKSSDDFGNFAEFNQDRGSEAKKEVTCTNQDEFGNGFTSFQQTTKGDNTFADFGSFESTNVDDGDDFGEFGTFQESTTSKSGAFSQQGDNDDDFGNFGSFSSNNTTSDDFGQFSTTPNKPTPTTHIPKVSGSKLEQVFRVCFPSNCSTSVETDNTINLLLHVIREESDGKDQKKKNKNGSAAINIWDKLQNMEKTNALTYQWADSNNNKQLLTALAIDTRNILSSKKKPTPIFASDLGLLIPSKAGEKVDKPQEPSPEETLISTSTPTTIPDEEASTKVEFDWSGSGLTNPLDANSLNLDFFVTETKSSLKSNRSLAGGLDSEFLGLEMSSPLAPPPGGSSTKPLDNILKNMQTSMVTQPKKDENLSQEANHVLSNLPQLSFMHAKVLMFPMNPVAKNSST